MIKLYLIGGCIVAAIIGIVGFYFAAKKAGREEEQIKSTKRENKNAKISNKIRSNIAADSDKCVRQRLRDTLKK